MVNGSGALGLTLSADGTAQSTAAVSSAAVSFTVGQVGWVRATWRASDGRVQFFTAADSATYPSSWTQLGTDQTGHVGAIFDSAVSLEVGSRWIGTSMLLTGTVYRAIVKNGIGGTTVFDADFDAQAPETTSFAESSSNAATVTMQLTNPTVTINTTRYSYGIPNTQSGSISTGNLTSGNDRYQKFVVTKPIVVDMVLMEVTTGPASAATVYFGLYASDANFQPTGNVLLATNIAVGTSATGVFTKQVTPVTLQAGTYLFATNPSVTMTVRTLVNGDAAIASTYGASGAILVISRGRTAATFGNNPNGWNTTATGSTVGSINYALLRYKEAS
jgi:hypothetical protein